MAAPPSMLWLLLLALLVLGVRGEAEREALISERRDACNRLSNRGIHPRDPSQFPNRFRSHGGTLQYASPADANMTDLDCAGVALLREIIRPYSLSRPRYSNAPHLLYVERGSGLLGIVTPGCPTTFRNPFATPSCPHREEDRRRRRRRPYDYESESERESEYEYEEEEEDEHETRQRRQQQEQEQGQEKEGDTCQKVRRVKEGDLVVIFAGNTFWLDNDNPSQELRLVAIVDVSNNQNQLDRRYKTFLVSGEARLESEEGGEEGGVSRGVLQGFSNDVLQRALDIGNTTILRHIERRVSQQRQQGQGLHIRLHRGQLDIPHPRQRRGEESQQYYEPEYEEEEEEDEYKEEEEEYPCERRGRRRGSGNGVAEEGSCSMRLRQSLNRADNADIYVRGAGRVNLANALKMPALQVVGLAADYVKLERRGAMFAPSFVVNAHRIMYVTRGRGRIQIVDDKGRRVFSGEVRQGQFLLIPQNFAAVKEATAQIFEWVAFLTDGRPLREQLVGRNSLIQSMPRQVVAATCGIRGNEAEQLIGSRQQTVGPILTPPSSYYYSRSSSSSRTYPEDLDSTTESQTTETETKTEAETETEAEAQTETQPVTAVLTASA
uniref:Legumin; 11S globulin n=1 Tax=Gnetum gnemon TaxID=3382 RepID=Q39775_GNEGN|nr:legumin; 11S globulin [Gnetum gnemon]